VGRPPSYDSLDYYHPRAPEARGLDLASLSSALAQGIQVKRRPSVMPMPNELWPSRNQPWT
jgi:hypothetical protein